MLRFRTLHHASDFLPAKQQFAQLASRARKPPETPKASLAPLRGPPINTPAALAKHKAVMGRSKAKTDKGNTSCYVQVLGLGTDTGDCVPSVLLFFDHYRFLFNAGEGFQRFCVQHKIKMGKTSSIFVTRSSTQAVGGLPGMLLTMHDMNVVSGAFLAGAGGPSMSLHGPSGLATLAAAVRTFVNTKDLGLKVHEFGSETPPAVGHEELEPVLQADVVTVTPAVLYAAGDGGDTATEEPKTNGSAAAAIEGDVPAAKRQRLDQAAAVSSNADALRDGQVVGGEVHRPSACYLCKLPDIPGKFLLEKAQALGVPRGPLYAKLKAGEAVEASDGRLVQPSEVLGPGTPGPLAIIIDVPSAAYLPALLSHPTLRRCQSTGAEKPQEAAAVAVHLSPAEVVALPDYQAWMAACGPETQHIVVNSPTVSTRPAMMPSSALIQAQLNVLAPAVFPLPPPQQSHQALEAASAAADSSAKVTEGHNLLRYWLRPLARHGVDAGEVTEPFSIAAAQEDLRKSRPDVLEAAKSFSEHSGEAAASDSVSIPESVRNASREEVEVVFLGTGAAIPAKYRNVTGMYVKLFKRGGMMLDCGEGSYGQLVRRFGHQGAEDAVTGLGAVWISHIHADHHAGLPRLLAVRRKVLGADAAPLLVIGPRPLRRALLAYANLEPLTFVYLDNAHTLAGAEPPEEAVGYLAAAKEKLGLSVLESVRVVHCAHSFGVVLKGTTGWSLAFSGDTRPCPALVQAARGVDMLIHEATFEDELEAEAHAKRHSLTREAVAAGREAGAYRTILTHFSQRYAKLPVIDDNFGESTCMAFDLMSVNLADLPALPRLLPTLQLLFKEDEEEDEDEEGDVDAAAAEDVAAAVQTS